MFNPKKIIIKSISITHSLDFDCIITDNSLCIVYEHLIGLKITGRFLWWGFLALNRVNNNRAVFEVRSPIKIWSTPRPGLGKSITLTGCISVLTYFTWSLLVYNFIKIYPTTIVWPLLLLRCLVFADFMICELCIFQCWCRPKLKNKIYLILQLLQKLIKK